MDEELAITFRHNPDRSRYEAQIGEHRAEATYRRVGDTLILDFVGVPSALRRRGIGGRLVQFALDDIRANGWRAVPHCPFVRAWLGDHPSYADLIASDA